MIRKIIPENIKKIIRPYFVKWNIWNIRRKHEKKLKEIRTKNNIKVAFLAFNESIWKYENLYFLMKKTPGYEPVVFICPFITYGPEIMEKEMNVIFNKFKNKGYTVIKTKDENGNFIDIKKQFNPDIVFLSTPWGHSLEQYQINNFRNQLTCYVHYGFSTTLIDYLSMPTLLYSWRYYAETNFQKEIAAKHPTNKGDNIIVTGFTGIDNLIDSNYKPNDPWKAQDRIKKKIIWAPHHTIPGINGRRDIFNSNFLDICDFMIDTANRLKNDIQVAFKPHPNLRGKLNSIWGIDKTNSYYEKWQNMTNGQLHEGNYTDLFLTSDALIHDSSSFLIEYLFINKPVLYFENTINKNQLNEIALKAINSIQLANKSNDIVDFIIDSVINNNDKYKETREALLDKYLMPPNNKLASENIIKDLNNEFYK